MVVPYVLLHSLNPFAISFLGMLSMLPISGHLLGPGGRGSLRRVHTWARAHVATSRATRTMGCDIVWSGHTPHRQWLYTKKKNSGPVRRTPFLVRTLQDSIGDSTHRASVRGCECQSANPCGMSIQDQYQTCHTIERWKRVTPVRWS